MTATAPDDLDRIFCQLQDHGVISRDLPPFSAATKAAMCKTVDALATMELRPEARITLTRLLRGGLRTAEAQSGSGR